MADKSLEVMEEEVYQINLMHGWFDKERSFGDDVALLHSEVSEMFEAYRNGFNQPTRMMNTAYPNEYNPNSMEAEAADILIRLLDTCRRHELNLQRGYEAKSRYNQERPYRHGNKVL